MLHGLGLLPQGNDNLVSYVIRLLRADNTNARVVGRERLRNQAAKAADEPAESKAATAPTGSVEGTQSSKAAKAPIASRKRVDKVATGQANASK